MSDGPVKGSVGRVRQALFTLLAVAVERTSRGRCLLPSCPCS